MLVRCLNATNAAAPQAPMTTSGEPPNHAARGGRAIIAPIDPSDTTRVAPTDADEYQRRQRQWPQAPARRTRPRSSPCPCRHETRATADRRARQWPPGRHRRPARTAGQHVGQPHREAALGGIEREHGHGCGRRRHAQHVGRADVARSDAYAGRCRVDASAGTETGSTRAGIRRRRRATTGPAVIARSRPGRARSARAAACRARPTPIADGPRPGHRRIAPAGRPRPPACAGR